MGTSPIVIPSWGGKERRGHFLRPIGAPLCPPKAWRYQLSVILVPCWWALCLDAYTTLWAPEVSLPSSLDAAANTGHMEPDITTITLNPGNCFFFRQAATRGCTGLSAPNCWGSPGRVHWVLPRTSTSISTRCPWGCLDTELLPGLYKDRWRALGHLSLIIQLCQHSMSRFPPISWGWGRRGGPHLSRGSGNRHALLPTPSPGEGEGLGPELAKTANGIEDQCGFRGRGKGAERALWGPLWGQHRPETSSGSLFATGPRDGNGCKILRFDSDLLKHEVELRRAGSWGPFRAKGHKVPITQLQSVTPWESDIIDQSPLAAVVFQADLPIITPALCVQLRMDSRDEARLLLGLQGHITQIGPTTQAIGAASPARGVEGVEITTPAAPYAQQLEAGQHGRCPPRTTSSTSGVHHLSHS